MSTFDDFEPFRRVTFVDDISPITADILNDLQTTSFNTFENVGLKVLAGRMTLRAAADGYTEDEILNTHGLVQSNGRVRHVADYVDTGNGGLTAGNPYLINLDPGTDTGNYINNNYDVQLKITDAGIGVNERMIGKTTYTGIAGREFENTRMIAGAIARADQHNKFTFQSIDDNSTPLSIVGDNNTKPNLYVEAQVVLDRPADYEPANPHHESYWEIVGTSGGGIKTDLLASDKNDTVVIRDNVYVPGNLTIDGELLFDQAVLGTLGASPWQQLDSAATVQEFADSTFDGLLPNPSHAPVNFYPLGTIVDWAIPHNFDIDNPQTWPIGWIPATVNLQYDMDDDCTRAWLTPLYHHFEGPTSVPSGTWTVPGSIDYAETDLEPFIFLGSMSYMVDNGSGPILSPDMQGYGHKFGEIQFTNPSP